MAEYVYAKDWRSSGFSGRVVNVKRGEVWDAADPFVKANPDLFQDEPIAVHRTVEPPPAPPMEDATAEPGKKRSIR